MTQEAIDKKLEEILDISWGGALDITNSKDFRNSDDELNEEVYLKVKAQIFNEAINQIKQAFIDEGWTPPKAVSPNKELFYELVRLLHQPETVRYTPQRVVKLRQRLKTFSGAELALAAKCIADDDFLMGDNPQKKKYGNIDYLLRNDEIVDKFLVDSGGDTKIVDIKALEF